MNNIKNKSKFKSGLTLIETLVAITVLMTGVILPMSIYASSISNARGSGNQITAYYLAQDALEFIRFRITTELNKNAIPPSPDLWFDDSDMGNCESGGGGRCTIDSYNDEVAQCTGSCTGVLLFDSNLNLYTHKEIAGVTSPSIFSRKVDFKNNPDKDGGRVYVVVKWTDGGSEKSVLVEDYLFKYR